MQSATGGHSQSRPSSCSLGSSTLGKLYEPEAGLGAAAAVGDFGVLACSPRLSDTGRRLGALASGGRAGGDVPPVLLLLWSKLVSWMEQELLPYLLERLNQVFGASGATGDVSGAFTSREVGRCVALCT